MLRTRTFLSEFAARIKSLALLGAALILSSASFAQISALDLPAELADWQAWVLSDSSKDCPLLVRASARKCSFNGPMSRKRR